MNKYIASIFVITLPALVDADEYVCSEHNHKLSVQSEGFEHVNHTVTLNERHSIKKLEDAMWFVEEVNCISKGFEITASHVQYNDPTKKIFTLKVTDNNVYTIE
jgi:hypothetical protein